MKRYMTEETAMFRLADYCARGERCSWELLKKLADWGIAEAARMRIMKELSERRYFDDERYARALAMDRIRFGKWGRRKVDQALWQKHISEDVRRRVLDEVDDADYLSVLKPLLQSRRRTMKASDDYELRTKLVRYALGRGFPMALIRQCIDVDDEMDIDEEADDGM